MQNLRSQQSLRAQMSFCDKHSPLINSVPPPPKTNVAAKSQTPKLRPCFGSRPLTPVPTRGLLWALVQGDVQTHEHLPSPGVQTPSASPLNLQVKESWSRRFKQASLKNRKKKKKQKTIHDQCDCSLSVITRGVVSSPPTHWPEAQLLCEGDAGLLPAPMTLGT